MLSSLTKRSATLLVSLLVLSLVGTPTGAAAAQAEASGAEDLGYGVGAVLTSMLYTPLKVAYAGVGLVAGGVGYVVTGGREDVANNIIQPAIGGNYVVTANQLRGREPVVFVGPSPSAEPMAKPAAEPKAKPAAKPGAKPATKKP